MSSNIPEPTHVVIVGVEMTIVQWINIVLMVTFAMIGAALAIGAVVGIVYLALSIIT